MTDELADLIRALEDDRPALGDDVIDAGIRAGRQSRQRRRRRTSVVAAAVSAAAAIGVASWIAQPNAPVPAPVPTPDPASELGDIVEMSDAGEPLLSCGDRNGWPASVMADGRPGLLTDAEARRTFQGMLDDPRISTDVPFRDSGDVEWRVLDGDAHRLTLGLGRWTERGPEGDDANYLLLEREGGRWEAVGWGDCQLAPVTRDWQAWAQIERRDAAPGSTSVTMRVSDCYGRDLGPILQEPVVEERPDAVVVYWTVSAVDGPTADVGCTRTPSVDRTVRLDAPLGDRPLLDGSSYPPAPIGRTGATD
ncbi:hypothetical protein [Nocardioides speluncae]|uniref:hypothetical protein n=1 Tax=Nocardioides speluncae TaxID=2670337 RepID=UPI000D698884|nr:hypothetical protein [Nocardioides speluncae]